MKIPITGLLTPMQVAAEFNCHLSTVYRMMNNGELNPVEVRGRKRIPESEIARLLAAKPVG